MKKPYTPGQTGAILVIDYGEKELLDPIALECMSDEEGTG
jgi:hypothetical protein